MGTVFIVSPRGERSDASAAALASLPLPSRRNERPRVPAMIGPVFGAEVVRAGRRGRAPVPRWLYAGLLVLQFLSAYWNYRPAAPAFGPPREPTAAETTAFARGFVDLILFQQFVLVVLAAPAFAAGAVTDEKSRGTLQQLLA